ncbi:unnamed protein product [Rotaria sp. Silwood1]|nr:unnamed protein product [Rotaria sp. Silwood1]CAF3533377.1 unnamed protein product [Rotaria sp. Silwood1]CAF4788577.1 unnamed protein product [Rotaria sp. Silwood1]
MNKGEKNKHSCLEWSQLFISFMIPAAIAIYTVLENNRELAIASQHRVQDLDIADDQRKETVLRQYQKTLCQLIEKYGSQFNQSSEVSLVARFATLSASRQLDSHRRNFLIRLLYNAKLITYDSINDQPKISLESANLTELSLIDGTVGQTLVHIYMAGAIMTKANFHGINIHGAIFNGAKLKNADFSSTTNSLYCSDMSCVGPNSASLYFEESDLTSALFSNAIYDNASFHMAKMSNTNLHRFRCDLCFFGVANMTQTNLQYVEISRSSFTISMFIQAVIHQSNFYENVDFSVADMSYTHVSHSKFTECLFDSTNLKSVTLHYNTFTKSTFKSAKMFEISILHSIFIDVNFTSADLSKSNWQYVRCERCIFNLVNFNRTDLSNSIFIESDFGNATITEDQLNQVSSLKGSILPNGTVVG